MQKNIVACVTAQISCEKIISAAMDLSKKLNCKLIVVTVQKAKEDAKIRANSLKILNTLSKITGCNIDIVYGDNLKALAVDLMYESYNSTDATKNIISSITDNCLEIPKSTLINW